MIERERAHLDAAYAPMQEAGSGNLRERSFLGRVARPFFQVGEDHERYLEVRSAELRPGGGWTLVWLSNGGLEHVVAVVDGGGSVKGRFHVDGRARVKLRDVVGDKVPEVFVHRILGTGLSTYPAEWTVYRATTVGALRSLVTHRKSHSQGSKFEQFAFLNHWEFDEHGHLTIRTVYSDCESFAFVPRCPLLNTTVAYRYDASVDRYLQGRRSAPARSGK